MLLPTEKQFRELDLPTQRKFEAKLIYLFGTFENFWKCNRQYGFRLSHDIEKNEINVVRSRECINCGTEVFSPPLESPESIIAAKDRTATVLCDNCGAGIEKLLTGKRK